MKRFLMDLVNAMKDLFRFSPEDEPDDDETLRYIPPVDMIDEAIRRAGMACC